MAEHFTAKDPANAPLTSPPFQEDTLIMLATGWTWRQVQETPERIIEEVMMYHNIRAEAEAAKLGEMNG